MPDTRHWDCPIELTKAEQAICNRLKHSGKLFVFLRTHRHQIIDDTINQQLLAMYADHPRGKPPVPAAQLAMATLLQAYEQKSDAAATLEAMFDRRWQMVLNCQGDDSPPFSQGTLCDFRHRLVAHDMDVTLLEHTVQLAKKLGGFGPKQLRVALDSAPLQGAGRVEDTFNLVGHALELLVDCAARLRQTTEEQVIAEAGTQLVGKSSIKAALDIDWSEPTEKREAINTLMKDVDALRQWLATQPTGVTEHKSLKECLSLLEHVLEQNIEPDPDGNGSRIIDGVAADRQISITDPTMRHGRKSSSRTINGFKQHIAIDMDTRLILATSVRAANEPEHKASEYLKPKVAHYGEVEVMSIDKGYLAADWTAELYQQGKTVIAKPWRPASNGLYGKHLFRIDLVNLQVTCPAGHTVALRQNKRQRAPFTARRCGACPQQSQCTTSKQGRTITLHEQEAMLQSLTPYVETATGRADARERVKVEHSLASVCNRKGPRARYRGLRLNEYDLNRTAMITNLHITRNLAA